MKNTNKKSQKAKVCPFKTIELFLQFYFLVFSSLCLDICFTNHFFKVLCQNGAHKSMENLVLMYFSLSAYLFVNIYSLIKALDYFLILYVA
jgi:hypothetical protein